MVESIVGSIVGAVSSSVGNTEGCLVGTVGSSVGISVGSTLGASVIVGLGVMQLSILSMAMAAQMESQFTAQQYGSTAHTISIGNHPQISVNITFKTEGTRIQNEVYLHNHRRHRIQSHL